LKFPGIELINRHPAWFLRVKIDHGIICIHFSDQRNTEKEVQQGVGSNILRNKKEEVFGHVEAFLISTLTPVSQGSHAVKPFR